MQAKHTHTHTAASVPAHADTPWRVPSSLLVLSQYEAQQELMGAKSQALTSSASPLAPSVGISVQNQHDETIT